MKKISILGVSFLSMIALVTVLFFNSCEDDPCNDIICVNGDCVSGICACDAGYEGADCTSLSRDKLITGSPWNSVNNSCISGQSSGQLTIASSSGDLGITLSNFGHLVCGAGSIIVDANMTGSDSFEIPTQIVCGTTYQGTGTIIGNQLSISYTYNDPNAGSGSCTDTYN